MNIASLFRASAPVLAVLAALASLESAAPVAADSDDTPPDALIGYTEFRTGLPGGRYVNVATMRAVVVKADGTGRRVLADETALRFEAQGLGWSYGDKPTFILTRSPTQPVRASQRASPRWDQKGSA